MFEPLNTPGAKAPTQGVLLAIDVGGTKTQVACYDPSSQHLSTRKLATHADGLRGEPALERILQAARDCVADFGAVPVASVAAVFPGVVRGSRLLMAPNTPGFEELDLPALLGNGLGTEAVMLDNDVKAGALAEARWGSLVGIDDAIYLNLGTGLAAAAIANGRLIRGRNGAAMEIGYMLEPFLDPSRANQWRTYEKGAAPLEEFFSGTALNQLASEMLGHGHRALDLFASDDRAVRQALEQRIAGMAVQVANLAVALDVSRIAIGGGLFHQASTLAPVIEQLIRQVVPFPPQIVAAHFTHDAPLWGALSMAMDAAGLNFIPDDLLSLPDSPRG
ncbi:ROK family protein [Pseudomonas gingeri]|uniref:ROK family protein n=1 Tax=Pseudomonas gingeri TaxID=117681 RepID=UPI0015A2D4EE|nr:ROK family protein [Pseudomonas gingeri]NWA05273.1 ROK family protein [Pseudomonas gingeri]NWA15070.1 ROK family protein [Pseudomonas gingeri]NWA55765.1 ROK family protein [Pseudomonas gingeri]NWA98524.1 ROK family protein [Pseudomonas gingeri]NWB02841.1 ROK family protein [Pseudomonas gingeri]